ncbi:MAG: hypothetical protein KKE17_13610 [Proteobacteria bacterium]|nr:hypothetical protein [Pseudomonadota bacterium]MBU1711034.1 hypothetical protein [Pseudomonadota bacterium]
MKNTADKKYLSQKAAETLSRLAEEIIAGQLTADNKSTPIKEITQFKIKEKQKGDTFQLEIFLQATIGSSKEIHLQEISEQSAAVKIRGNAAKKPYRKKSGSPAEKQLKKSLNRLWKNVSTAILNAETPAANQLENLRKTWDDYTLFVERDWQAEWDECTIILKDFLASIEKGDLENAAAQLAEINRMTKACHKKYK